ncbi:MAG: hypothetical protein JWM95_4604 [Gemmatimonadetes bacterium]|nr:hypothetical protein [Gemmatimonadota bacterium]
MTTLTSYLVQLPLPLYDEEGNYFPAGHYTEIRREFTSRFGGVTSYSRAPAEGLWEDDRGHAQRDEIMVCEVMTDTLDRAWWSTYRHSLEDRFAQDEQPMKRPITPYAHGLLDLLLAGLAAVTGVVAVLTDWDKQSEKRARGKHRRRPRLQAST